MEVWGWPQWVYIGIAVFGVGATALMHGKPKTAATYNFWEVAFLQAATIWLLWMGGFFG